VGEKQLIATGIAPVIGLRFHREGTKAIVTALNLRLLADSHAGPARAQCRDCMPRSLLDAAAEDRTAPLQQKLGSVQKGNR